MTFYPESLLKAMAKPGIIAALILIMAVSSCKTTQKTAGDDKVKQGQGMLRQLSLDGCAWVIETDKDQKLEPMNLHRLSFDPKDGKAVSFTYELSNSMSTCMAGTPVEIKSIRYK